MKLYHIYQARKGKAYTIKAGNFLSRRENSNERRDLSIKEKTSPSLNGPSLSRKGPFFQERGLSITEGTSLSRKGPFYRGGDLLFIEEPFFWERNFSIKGHLFLARNITFHREKDLSDTETNSPCQPLHDKYLCDKLLKFLCRKGQNFHMSS